MHRTGLIVGLVVILAGAGYAYHVVRSKCPVPLSYAIGTIDERFELSYDEVRTLVSEVESHWEDATGRNLFSYDPDASFSINFVFDERQQRTVEEYTLREVLDRTESMSAALREEYESLLAEYETLRSAYDARVAAYENTLAVHNGEVAYWNTQGGAPPEMYERLNAQEEALQREREALNKLTGTLNALVDRVNALGKEGNEAVRDYNDQVAEYNNRFHEESEFTQGDYQSGRINIYQFADERELKLVLAHELGHAISLGHVDDPEAVMYYLMDGQGTELTLTQPDLAEFARVCGVR